MWKIEIKEELNSGSEFANTWFAGFDEDDEPTFTNDKNEAIEFVDIKELHETIVVLYEEFSLESYW